MPPDTFELKDAMTDFRSAYQTVHDSVVGLGFRSGRELNIFGTGVVAGQHSNGLRALIATNRHIIEALNEQEEGDNPIAVLFRNVSMPSSTAEQWLPGAIAIELPVRVYATMGDPAPDAFPKLDGFQPIATLPYGAPDLGVVVVDSKPLCAAQASIKSADFAFYDPVPEGTPLALLGYPLGLKLSPSTPADQVCLNPLLQAGILSAIRPSRIAPTRTYVLHLSSNGGASGSPVFTAGGKVVALVYDGNLEQVRGAPHLQVSTSQLLAVPVDRFPQEFIDTVRGGDFDTHLDTLESLIRGARAARKP